MSEQCYPQTILKEHVHELQGTVQIAELNCDPHNHRFTTTTGEAIRSGLSHYHEVCFKTDTYEDHEHTFYGKTCLAVPVGDRHVHFLADDTEPADSHKHDFRASTFMEDLIGD